MKSLKLILVIAASIISNTANSALVERLGGLAYYDTEADLTWLADANAAGITMNWADANSWVTGLTVDGVSGWRLPDTLQPDESCSSQTYASNGYNCSGSELGNMFYNVLGGTAYTDLTASHNANYDLFSNIEYGFENGAPTGGFWSSTDYQPVYTSAWAFFIYSGYQQAYDKSADSYAWAVKSGDVSAVPVPAALWLFGSGIISLVGFARRKK